MSFWLNSTALLVALRFTTPFSANAAAFAPGLKAQLTQERPVPQDHGNTTKDKEKNHDPSHTDPGEKNAKKGFDAPVPKVLTKEERIDFIRRAQVWMPTDVAAHDMKAGPDGKDAFAPNQTVSCVYVETKFEGKSPKFECIGSNGERLKVRYGPTNGEIQGSVLASRLLWALGFGADRFYPVKVICHGCPEDPMKSPEKIEDVHEFDLAVIERKHPGDEIKAQGNVEGWSWPELALVSEAAGGAPKAQRDALTLLAIFMQHSDSKPQQQRLLCLPGGLDENGLCNKPFLAIHDVGLTFGHASFSNNNLRSGANYEGWADAPVWRDAKKCIGHQSKSASGTLEDPKISEAGRAFLANLLSQLTDTQLHDLFEVARVERRSRKPDDPNTTVSADVEEWVALFKHKRAEITDQHCPE
jgi:hypothetical protein